MSKWRIVEDPEQYMDRSGFYMKSFCHEPTIIEIQTMPHLTACLTERMTAEVEGECQNGDVVILFISSYYGNLRYKVYQ